MPDKASKLTTTNDPMIKPWKSIAESSKVETLHFRATKDSTAGRLLAKKMKKYSFSREKRCEKAAQSAAQKPLEEEEIQLFFSDIEPLAASKVLFRLEGDFIH